MQISLNAFLVSFCVVELEMTLTAAGAALAMAQTGGLVGRVFWGVVGDRLGHTRLVLGPLGLAMAAAAVATVATEWTFPALVTLCFFFGLTASGWNGLFLAEVARLAPEGPCQRGNRGRADSLLHRPCSRPPAVRPDGGVVQQLRAGLPDHGRCLPCGGGVAYPAPN